MLKSVPTPGQDLILKSVLVSGQVQLTNRLNKVKSHVPINILNKVKSHVPRYNGISSILQHA